jgi:uncharacterized protein
VANLAHALRVNAAELLRQPGLSRQVDVELPAAAVGVDDERVSGDLHVALTATSAIEAVSVHGTITTPWRAVCRRCLVEVEGISASRVDERYQAHPHDADTFEIVGDQIDLVPVVREYVLLDLPDAPLCKDDCAGICPACGIDRNTGACDCETAPSDLRWAALEDLKFEVDE